MNHCMIVHNYYPFAETRVQREAEALAESGIQVDVICLRHGREPNVEQVAGVTAYRLPLSRNKESGPLGQLLEYLGFFVMAFYKVTRLHLHRRYRVVQVHNLPDFLIFAALFPRLMGSRLILDLHDLMPEFFSAKFNKPMDNFLVRLVRWQEWLSCRFAHHVITVTELWRQTLVRRGVPENKCSVVMNVADPRYFSQAAAPAGLPENGHFYLLYHGTLTQRYGVDLVLQALAKVRQEIPDVHLIMHGRGEYQEDVRRFIQEWDLQDAVQFSTEFLPVADLPRLIKSGHLGLVPYRRDIFTDGILPTKLMEYAALGVPAVVVRTPAIKFYFDETMVEFFAAEDVDDLVRAISKLYRDRERLNELACGITRFNQQYSWAAQSAGYVRLVERLAGR